jgi:hypothetical protein
MCQAANRLRVPTGVACSPRRYTLAHSGGACGSHPPSLVQEYAHICATLRLYQGIFVPGLSGIDISIGRDDIIVASEVPAPGRSSMMNV